MKLLLGIALALGIGAVAYGAASGITVGGGKVESGSATAGCDTDVALVFGAPDGFGVIDDATVSGIDASCAGGTGVNVSLTADTAAELTVGSGTTGCVAYAASIPVTLTNDLTPAEQVTLDHTHVTILSC